MADSIVTEIAEVLMAAAQRVAGGSVYRWRRAGAEAEHSVCSGGRNALPERVPAGHPRCGRVPRSVYAECLPAMEERRDVFELSRRVERVHSIARHPDYRALFAADVDVLHDYDRSRRDSHDHSDIGPRLPDYSKPGRYQQRCGDLYQAPRKTATSGSL
jgi:hypothetical protein